MEQVMTEKIDWYREVLEIEPNSKVFFPLAKLLVKENNSREAIEVLAHGLDRHPEFLEARLLLIELMHKNGEKEACERQIAKLSSMFASYAGFWEAWAACLSSQPGDADTASIIRFLAAHFISGPLQLHDVLNRGLEAILHDKAGGVADAAAKAAAPAPVEAAPAPEAVQEQTGNAAAQPAEPEAREETQDLPVAENQPQEDAGNEVIDDAVNAEKANADAVSAAVVNADEGHDEIVEPAAAMENDSVPEDSLPCAEKGEENNPEVETQAQDIMPAAGESAPPAEELPAVETGDAADAGEIPEQEEIPAEKSNTAQIASELAKIASSIPQNAGQAESEDNDAVENAAEEPFSLRTRSMAEVLAEQGDYKGALEIYLELAEAGPGESEAAEINSRIEELKARCGKDSPIPAPQEENPASKSKEKLIGMLEALAQRVEARVQN